MRPVVIAACLLLLAPITDSWWASGSAVILDPRMVCKKNRRTRGRLAQICRNETGLVKEITKGVTLGATECAHQFRSRRWNCTTQRRSMRKILMRDTRETGFVNAITAAGVTFSITRACTAGSLLECSCEKGIPKPRRGHDPVDPPPTQESKNKWQWGGCSDNVRFGLKKSREFMDSRYRKRSDIKTLIKLHNHNAGRLAIKNNMKIECKCHGLSGSCTLRTCWWRMPTFREVGDRLRDRFEGAAKVIASNDGDSFMPESPSIKKPGKKDIIYSEESPDFCAPNLKTGSLGTQGRQCNISSAGTDGCDQMCCRRGYVETTINETENCNCQFKWCCEVICETCNVKRNIQTCL
ncbi:protein Wnt-6 [Bombyx mori]|uniref:Protein Wnt n=1 Tax=Bombyx mori TaxID=7091 RepID=A0A8R2LUK6_BOMMO|nr:protein Wnt-6 [Bombyx mori]